MRKNILHILTFLFVSLVMLTGCGSSDNKGQAPIIPPPTPPAPPAPPVNVNGYAFDNLTSKLNIISYEKYNIEFQLTQYDLAVPGAPVAMKVFDHSLGSVESNFIKTDENGRGNFIYIPPTVFPEAGTLTITYTDGNITIEAPITLNFNLNTDDPDGRATTLSIAYENSTCDEKRGIIGHYHVHAVDRKSNLPLVGIPVEFSLVNGVVVINNTEVQKAKGNIYDTDPVTFIDHSINFLTQTKVKSGDNLIIFPSEDKTDASYLGGWDIKTIGENLTFSEHYLNLLDTAELTYIVGNEQRLLGGENGEVGTLANAHVEAVESTTDAEGYAYFDIVSDMILAGHTVTIEAHGDENGNRVGVSQKVFLRLDGDDFSTSPTEVPNSQDIKEVRIPLTINPTCSGSQPLIDVPVASNSFTITPAENCAIVGGDFHTDSSGTVTLFVDMDGNTTVTENCTITWDGGPGSLRYEY